MNSKVIKPEVKRLYIEGKDVPEMCDMFNGLNPSTVYTWIRNENWKSLRDSKMKKYIKSPEILMEMLNQSIESITQEKLLIPGEIAKVADSVSKIVKSIKTLSKDKDRLGSVLFVIGELGLFMNENDKNFLFDEDFRSKFDKLLQGFQERMVLKYSTKNFS